MRLLRYAMTPLLVRHTVHLLERCSGFMCACTISEVQDECTPTFDRHDPQQALPAAGPRGHHISDQNLPGNRTGVAWHEMVAEDTVLAAHEARGPLLSGRTPVLS